MPTRFAVSPPWRFVVTGLHMGTLTFLDRLASNRTLSFTLNQPANCALTVPSETPEVNILVGNPPNTPFVSFSNRLLFAFRRDEANSVGSDDQPWTVRFAGIIQQVSDVAGEERSQTTITAFDPWQYLYARPVCKADGSLPDADGLVAGTPDLPWNDPGKIALQLLYNTYVNHGTVFIDAGLFAAGSSPNGVGDMGTGLHVGPLQSLPPIDITFQRGQTVGEAWNQLCKTGALDIVLTPIYRPIDALAWICDLAIYAQAGTTRNNAIFAWDKPSKSLTQLTRLVDAASMANRIVFFNGQGGNPVFASGTTPVSDLVSINQYGEYWYTQAFPQTNGDAAAAVAIRAMSEAQLALRSQGKTTVTFTPAPERSPDPFNEYWLGDRVPIYASDRFRLSIPGP